MSERYKTPGGHNRKKTTKQLAFEAYFHDPTSPTYCNALQSALKAGYSQNYAERITVDNPYWLDSDTRRKRMLEQAERNLEWIANQNPEELKRNPQLFKTFQDTIKFLSERLGKEHYSTRQELVGKGGKALFGSEHKQLAEQALANLMNNPPK